MVCSQLHVPAALLRGKNFGTHGIGDWVDPRPVWMFLKGKKYLAPTENRTPNRPARGLVPIPTTLTQLPPKYGVITVILYQCVTEQPSVKLHHHHRRRRRM
jgi:hypothetical protein